MIDKTRFAHLGEAERLVYVKPVAVEDLPEDVRIEAGDAREIFALHNAAGQQLALVADRNTAFFLARQNNMVPLTLH